MLKYYWVRDEETKQVLIACYDKTGYDVYDDDYYYPSQFTEYFTIISEIEQPK